MNQIDLAGLHVHSDLHLEIGDVRVDLTADGHRLHVHANSAPRLLAEVTGAALPHVSLRRAVSQVAQRLGDVGLSAQIEDGRGTLLELGVGCGSPSGRLLFGTDHARLGAGRALLPVAATYLVSSVGRRVKYAAAAGVVVAVLLGVAGSRRASISSGPS